MESSGINKFNDKGNSWAFTYMIDAVLDSGFWKMHCICEICGPLETANQNNKELQM